ncbi:MAG: hypothetical protein R2810_09240 [Flavobacteriales bacterium]
MGRYAITGDSKIVMVNFVPSGLGALFTGFKNQDRQGGPGDR